MGAHVDLQRRTGAEIATTDVAEVLVVHRRIQAGAGRSGRHQCLLKVQRTSGKSMGICADKSDWERKLKKGRHEYILLEIPFILRKLKYNRIVHSLKERNI